MTTAELRCETKKRIDGLPSRRLRLIAALIRDMDQLESWEATDELMRIPGFEEDMKAGEADIAAGRTVNWREVRGDV